MAEFVHLSAMNFLLAIKKKRFKNAARGVISNSKNLENTEMCTGHRIITYVKLAVLLTDTRVAKFFFPEQMAGFSLNHRENSDQL